MTTVSGTPAQIIVQMEGIQGPPGAAGESIIGAPLLGSVLTSDLVPIVRGGSIYLATVASVLAAGGVTPPAGQLNFSINSNSMYLGIGLL